jgi:hypothetical protein
MKKQQRSRQQLQQLCQRQQIIAKHLAKADKWWATKLQRSLRIAVRDLNHREGGQLFCICIFGEPTYFSGEQCRILCER